MTKARARRKGSLLVLTAGLAAIAVTGACGGSGDPVPAELLGVWRTEDGAYAGRTLTIAETTISFSQGEHAYQEYPIVGAELQDQGSSEFYVVRYRNGEQVQQIALSLEWGSEPVVRLQNRADIRWHRENGAD